MRRATPLVALCVFALTLGALGTGGPSGGAAQAAPNLLGFDQPLNLIADEITVDNQGTGLVARGHVRVTYGADRATADLLHLIREPRTAVMTGHVQVLDPQGRASGDTVTLYLTPDNQIGRAVLNGTAVIEGKEYSLTADLIDADRAAGRMVAQGHVNGFGAPDLLITGDRITYDQRAQHAVVTGHPVVSNKAGRLTGDWLEMFQAEHRAVVHGPVQAEVYGATLTGAGATVDFRRSVAVFSGHVIVIRRQGTVWADRVVVFYEAKRIRAEGETHAVFRDTGEESTP